MNNFIIGTAGHIDHGKTTLIKALSGIATDRLKEEQKRGISIVNGYAFINYKDKAISIIDVPGHEKFIKNMLSGISGINYVIVVVAADEGIMPQTIEHLDIIQLLGIDKGVFVITKCDMVDDEFQMVVEEEINDYKTDTILKDFDIMMVSSHTGSGIEALKEHIYQAYDNYEYKAKNEYQRLLIDRAFINKGVGSIVTGTLEANDMPIRDNYMIYPSKKEIKIKTIESHDKTIQVADMNSRVALNINTQDVKRGDIIALAGKYDVSNSVIIKLNVLNKYKEFIRDMDYKFYFGSKELIGKLVHLNENYFEMFFEEKYIFYSGQRGILRFMSPVLTIAGIEVIDPFSKRGRKNKINAVSILKNCTNQNDRVEYIMTKHSNGISFEDLEIETNSIVSKAELENFINIGDLYFTNKSIDNWKRNFTQRIYNFFKNNSYSLYIEKEVVRSKYYSNVPKKVFDELLKNVIKEKNITIFNNKISIVGRKINFTADDKSQIDRILKEFENYKLMPPTDRQYSQKEQLLIKYLLDTGDLVLINSEIFLKKDCYLSLKNDIMKMLNLNNSVSISDMKNRFDITRKYIIPILEHFDSVGLTIRKDNVRVLKKGEANG